MTGITSINFVIATALLASRMSSVSSTSFNEGVCDVEISRLESRYVPYVETYKKRVFGIFYKTQERINYKTEYHVVFHREKQCCPNYESIGNRCEPVCSHGCWNGECTRPNFCECHPGYEKSTTNSSRCEPVCSNPCVRGVCVMPDTCVCQQHYILDSDGFTCQPTCQQNCENEDGYYCADIDTCACKKGYIEDQSHSPHDAVYCLPFCEVDCINGHCVAPNTCSCLEGYEPHPHNKFQCIPKCSHGCENGHCVEPETCLCSERYQFNPNTLRCEIGCDPRCINGHCDSSGLCICNERYVPNTNVNLHDEPLCVPECLPSCPENAYCNSGVCKCFNGYRIVKSGNGEGTEICEPICEDDCPRGSRCIHPEVCECIDGYEIETPHYPLTCRPVCDYGCQENQTCTEPNVCSCAKGYRMNENSICEPVCEVNCGYGLCVGPNECECFEGYELSSSDAATCVHRCEGGCGENSDCVATAICECREGYVRVENGSCESECFVNCTSHGFCVNGTSSCDCFYGWTGDRCELAAVCSEFYRFNDTAIEGLAIANETNATIQELYGHAPSCRRCSRELNETLCFVINYDNTDGVGCLIESETNERRNCSDERESAELNVPTVAGSIVACVVFVIAATTVALYLVFQGRREKKNGPTITIQNTTPNELGTDEPLIDEEGYF